MLLENKIAVIYGAGGSIGGAVARAFATEGATVYLCGRHAASIDIISKLIKAEGGKAETAIVDALDENSINDFIDQLIAKEGRLDISFNAIGMQDVQDIPLVGMALEDYLRPIEVSMKTQFLTAKAAGKHMMKQESGVILAITATPSGKAFPKVGGFGPACSAIEGFIRNLASELGPHGVRVICIRSAGSPDSRYFIEAMLSGGPEVEAFILKLAEDTMLKRLPLMAEIANTAAFLASDRASGMTGTVANVTCGTTMD